MRAMNRTEAAMAEIRARIAQGTLGPGDRLPSVRQFAAQRGLSPSTVVEAYDRLAAEGVIRSRPGSGFYAIGLPRVASMDMARQDRAVDPFWVSRQSLDADAGMLKPGCGWLPDDWMPQTALRRALRELARADGALLTDYGPSKGELSLRAFLARQFGREGLPVMREQILLTGSGSQAIDLICRLLLRPGDTVLVDDPCYFNFRALLQAHRVQVAGVPYTQGGPDLTRFEAVLAAQKPRLYLTNSALHNPTGATMAPQVAHRLLMLYQRVWPLTRV